MMRRSWAQTDVAKLAAPIADRRGEGSDSGALYVGIYEFATRKVPPGVPLASGLTGTVTIRNGKHSESRTLFQRMRGDLEASLLGLFGGDPMRLGCIPNPS
jgi:hypothetical protein